MADLNKDFFNKVYPDNKTKDLKHFEKDVSQEISSNYTRDTDMLFKYNIYDKLFVNIKLPDKFLQNWILSKNNVNEQNLLKDYENYSRYFKTQLIENNIISSNNIEVSKKDLEVVANKHVIDQFKYYGNRNIDSNHLKKFVDQVLENKEEKKKLQEVVLNNKVISFLKTCVKVQEKSISINEFVKLAEKYKN